MASHRRIATCPIVTLKATATELARPTEGDHAQIGLTSEHGVLHACRDVSRRTATRPVILENGIWVPSRTRRLNMVSMSTFHIIPAQDRRAVTWHPWKFKDFDHDPDIPDEHIEDRMAKEAVAFMEQHQDEPFFLNYWMFSVHAPFDAKQSLIDKYREARRSGRSATQPDVCGDDRKHGRCRRNVARYARSAGSRRQYDHHVRFGQRRQHVQRGGRHDRRPATRRSAAARRRCTKGASVDRRSLPIPGTSRPARGATK